MTLRYEEFIVEALSGERLEVYEKFEDMNLSSNLLRGINEYGYERPTAIQKRVIVPFTRKTKDIIAQAQAGTGKTAAIGIGVLANIDPKLQAVQAIIISPTREISTQTTQTIRKIAKYMEIVIVECIGGKKEDELIREVKANPHVITGTPGRIKDLIRRRVLSTDHLVSFVLDEADDIVGRGSSSLIYDISLSLPNTSHIALFSPTLTPEAMELAEKLMKKPLHIRAKIELIILDAIKLFYINAEREEWKLDTLCDIFDHFNLYPAVIFCHSIPKVTWLANQLRDKDFFASMIHEELSHQEREEALEEVREGKSRILLSTDRLARGFDLPSVSMVVIYDLPSSSLNNYIYQIGKCGRFGKKGVVINLSTSDDLSALELFYQISIEELPLDISTLL